MTTLESVGAQLGEIRRRIEGPLGTSPAVSGWSVAQHLDHSLKVGAGMLRRIVKPSTEAMPALDWRGHAVLLLGRIPRGKGKSPAAVEGVEVPAEALLAAHDACTAVYREVADRPVLLEARSRVMRHPYFGGLTAAQTLRFVEIHTDHHLRIVDDILSSRGSATGR